MKVYRLLTNFLLVFILSMCFSFNVYADTKIFVSQPKQSLEFNVEQLSSENSSGASSGWTTGSFSESSNSYDSYSGGSSGGYSGGSSMTVGDYIALLRFLQMFLFFLPPSMRPVASVIFIIGAVIFYVKKVKQ